jgi:hypothetical protein
LRRLIGIVANAEAANAADIGLTLLESRKAAIHRAAHRTRILRAPGIVLRVRSGAGQPGQRRDTERESYFLDEFLCEVLRDHGNHRVLFVETIFGLGPFDLCGCDRKHNFSALIPLAPGRFNKKTANSPKVSGTVVPDIDCHKPPTRKRKTAVERAVRIFQLTIAIHRYGRKPADASVGVASMI